MLLGEPPPTQADLHFRILGIPVRVHPFFWLVALFLGMGGSETRPVDALTWVAAVFLSILVHEMGHALAARRHGWHPSITLYGLGGLATYTPTHETTRSRVLISAAGPAAGFLFALLIILAVRLSGHPIGLVGTSAPLDFDAIGAPALMRQPLVLVDIYFAPLGIGQLDPLVADLLVVNILWGIVNLFPVYPLDGGQIARELLVTANPREGIRQSLWLSVGCAAGLASVALMRNSLFAMLMFGYLAYTSYRTLQAYSGSGQSNRW
ncbi:MAG: site-2 protease family protein [Pirellulales bacterium]